MALTYEENQLYHKKKLSLYTKKNLVMMAVIKEIL